MWEEGVHIYGTPEVHIYGTPEVHNNFLFRFWSLVFLSSMAGQPDSGIATVKVHPTRSSCTIPIILVWLLFLNLSLVSVTTDGVNSMIMVLTANDKVGFIDRSNAKPFDSSGPYFLAWKRCNTVIFSWLLYIVSKEILSSIIYADSIKEIWEDLKQIFSQRPKLMHLMFFKFSYWFIIYTKINSQLLPILQSWNNYGMSLIITIPKMHLRCCYILECIYTVWYNF